jgi:hypothetical protein
MLPTIPLMDKECLRHLREMAKCNILPRVKSRTKSVKISLRANRRRNNLRIKVLTLGANLLVQLTRPNDLLVWMYLRTILPKV